MNWQQMMIICKRQDDRQYHWKRFGKVVFLVMAKKGSRIDNTGIVSNLKKGLTELLVLKLLNEKTMSIYEIIKTLKERSEGTCCISYPYAVIYRLQNGGFITDAGKSVTDDRLRFSYRITASGKERLTQMLAEYEAFMQGVSKLLD